MGKKVHTTGNFCVKSSYHRTLLRENVYNTGTFLCKKVHTTGTFMGKKLVHTTGHFCVKKCQGYHLQAFEFLNHTQIHPVVNSCTVATSLHLIIRTIKCKESIVVIVIKITWLKELGKGLPL